ncbi:MAG: hypothetical protein AAFR94_02550 [Pseudomonadota bacterium]
MAAATQPPFGRPAAPRAAMLLALCLAVALLAVRASQAAMTGPAAGPTSQHAAEYLLEPLVGVGHVRVVSTGQPSSMLVLLDTASDASGHLSADDIATLFTAAGLYSPLAGDTLTIRRTPFLTTQLAGPQGIWGWIELAALGLLSAAISAAMLWPQSKPERDAETRRLPQASKNGPGRTLSAVAPSPQEPMPEPTRMASIIRDWIREDMR